MNDNSLYLLPYVTEHIYLVAQNHRRTYANNIEIGQMKFGSSSTNYRVICANDTVLLFKYAFVNNLCFLRV